MPKCSNAISYFCRICTFLSSQLFVLIKLQFFYWEFLLSHNEHNQIKKIMISWLIFHNFEQLGCFYAPKNFEVIEIVQWNLNECLLMLSLRCSTNWWVMLSMILAFTSPAYDFHQSIIQYRTRLLFVKNILIYSLEFHIACLFFNISYRMLRVKNQIKLAVNSHIMT